MAHDRQQQRRRRSPHVPALDGVRAVAVVAVLAFHGGLPGARGGFLGVDAFFVLSGYLITALLLADGIAALLYVANWRMILRGGDYFAQTAAPSPLEHTWSLGIEEQFYLAWPLVLCAVDRKITRLNSSHLVISY